METKEIMSKTFRCCRTALLVVAAILVVTGTAFAQTAHDRSSHDQDVPFGRGLWHNL